MYVIIYNDTYIMFVCSCSYTYYAAQMYVVGTVQSTIVQGPPKEKNRVALQSTCKS